MRSARCCGLSAAVGLAVEPLATVLVRFLVPAAGVAARFGVAPVSAVLVADFRFVDRLDSDLDAVLILLVSIRSDRRRVMPGATFWRTGGSARRLMAGDLIEPIASSGQRLVNPFEKRLGVDLRRTGACALGLVNQLDDSSVEGGIARIRLGEAHDFSVEKIHLSEPASLEVL